MVTGNDEQMAELETLRAEFSANYLKPMHP
jgi:hypothetical protein